MSEVWEAEDLDTGRHVALKALGWRLHSAADHARFLREGRLAARVNHPNIVYVFGTEEIEGVPVIAMELASGGTLKDLVTADGPMRPARAVDVMLQVIAGLEAAAAAGVLHRDIKPSNCFVDAEGRIQVGDFGIAAATSVQPEATLTRTGGLLCTPTFASPEQLRGAPLDVRSDIYAVGATLYYLLTGRPPFDDANVVRLIERVLHERPTAVRAVRRDVPRPLDSIIQQCLAKNPAERPHVVRAPVETTSAVRIRVASAGAAGSASTCHVSLTGLFVRTAGRRPPVSRPGAVAAARARKSARVARLCPGALRTPRRLLRGHGRRVVRLARARWSSVCASSEQGDSRSAWGDRLLVRCSGGCHLMPGAFIWIALWPFELGVAAWSAGLSAYLAAMGTVFTGIGILFSRARRANGFAGLHDLATQTRVVLKLAVEPTSARTSAVEAPPVLPPALTRLGPYVVLDETAAPGVVVGFDQQLARRVWIRRAPPGTPAVSLARRNVSRPTRLRWLTGSRDTDDGWDAYEAAAGEPLRSASQRPRTWATVRGWLQDLAQEITAAGEDGTCLPLDFERVWVTNGRARLLDWLPDGVEGASEVPESVNSPDVHRAQRFLYDVAMLGLYGSASLV